MLVASGRVNTGVPLGVAFESSVKAGDGLLKGSGGNVGKICGAVGGIGEGGFVGIVVGTAVGIRAMTARGVRVGRIFWSVIGV